MNYEKKLLLFEVSLTTDYSDIKVSFRKENK